MSYPVQVLTQRGLVPAQLRSASRSGYWMVYADNLADGPIRYVGPRSLPCKVALDGPITAWEAAQRFPQHADAINNHPDSTD